MSVTDTEDKGGRGPLPGKDLEGFERDADFAAAWDAAIAGCPNDRSLIVRASHHGIAVTYECSTTGVTYGYRNVLTGNDEPALADLHARLRERSR